MNSYIFLMSLWSTFYIRPPISILIAAIPAALLFALLGTMLTRWTSSTRLNAKQTAFIFSGFAMATLAHPYGLLMTVAWSIIMLVVKLITLPSASRSTRISPIETTAPSPVSSFLDLLGIVALLFTTALVLGLLGASDAIYYVAYIAAFTLPLTLLIVTILLSLIFRLLLRGVRMASSRGNTG